MFFTFIMDYILHIKRDYKKVKKHELNNLIFLRYPHPLYSMYQDVTKNEADGIWLHTHAIRYDITTIPPGYPGGEFAKTKGHYHPENPAGIEYPELYEVIEDVAHVLLKKKRSIRSHSNSTNGVRTLFMEDTLEYYAHLLCIDYKIQCFHIFSVRVFK